MHDHLVFNKYVLLNEKVKYKWMLYILILGCIMLFLLTILIKTYDSYKTVGRVVKNQIILNLNVEDINNIITSDFIKINDKKLNFSIESISNASYNDYLNESYQTVILSTSDTIIDNLNLDIIFYKNKQRIIKKIVNLLI